MQLQPGGIIAWIVVGLIAGWLTGLIMKRGGYGIIGDLILGLIGALIGGFIVGFFFQGSVGLIGSIVVAVIGAIILVLLLRLITRGRVRGARG
ncbi:MAG: GlsB/YeaQ/YmgE family stress response membrane protein [Candidatus Dormiibacterota bacterium]